MKIAIISLNLKESRNNRDEIVAWLHSKAEEIKDLKDEDYSDNPKWSYEIN